MYEGKVPVILAHGLYADLKNKFVGFVEKENPHKNQPHLD